MLWGVPGKQPAAAIRNHAIEFDWLAGSTSALTVQLVKLSLHPLLDLDAFHMSKQILNDTLQATASRHLLRNEL